MTHEHDKKKEANNQNKDASVQPEPETLHTTDPQENMEGPVSSLVKKAGESLETDETKEEADREKDENM